MPPRSYSFGKILAKRGHEVSYMAISRNSIFSMKREMNDKMEVIQTPDLFWGRARSGWDPWNTIRRIIHFQFGQKRKFDIVHGFECRPVTIFPILTLLKKQSDLLFFSDWNDWWGRGGLIKERRPIWYRILFGAIETYFEEAFRTKADGITVISSALYDRAQNLGIDESKICRIPGGVDCNHFFPISKKNARSQLGLPESAKIVLFSAADVIIDLDLVLNAFVRVSREFKNAKLVLTGNKAKLTQKVAREQKIQNNIIELGMVSYENYPKYLACADVFLIPFKNTISNIGRWPNKAQEYMAVGRPIVSNPVGDIKGLFDRERIGLLAREEPEDFAEKIIHLFKNPRLCDEFGNNGRRVAEEQFAWPILTKRLENFYSRFIINA